jgi:penicillin-binding protein 1C
MREAYQKNSLRVFRKKRIRMFRDRLLKAVIAVGLVSFLSFSIWLWALARNLPNPAEFGNRAIKQSTKIYDRTGTVLLYEVHGEERRTVIPFEEIPSFAKYATLAAEDAGFYRHPAFDIRAIIRAIWHNLTKTENQSIQGGSTITQQLVKNAFLTPERTITRKIKELILAIEFERRYSKDEILAFYLNQIPYGSNAYGIEAASQTYFGKHAAQLSLREAATLAALLKAPSYYAANPDELKKRTDYVLDRMVAEGFISSEEAKKAKEERIKFVPFIRGIRAPHFVMYVKQLLEEEYGRDVVENGGLKVITSLDIELQKLAEKIVSEAALKNEAQWKASNAALIAEDPKTGQILAMVGSRDFFGTSKPEGCTPGLTCTFDPQVNATLRLRQPGSALKPFVYYRAFTKGYTPSTIVFDLPTEFNPNCTATGEPIVAGATCYHPKNYDESWRGPVTLKRALAQSLNIPAVKVLYLVGIDEALKTLKDFGITTLDQPPEFYGLSLVLGGGGVKLNELTHAYSALAQDGILRPQTAILRVEDAQGKVLKEFEDNPIRVADSQYVRIVNEILSDSAARLPVFPPGALDVPGWKIAAKTGTSQDYIDAWVFGYTPTLVTGVWVGNNNNAPMARGGAGVAAAAPIMKAFLEEALPKFGQEDFPKPETIPSSSKPMLSGKYVVMQNGLPVVHSILYYVDRNDPLGPAPLNPANDPQFTNWELPVRAWSSLTMPSLGGGMVEREIPPQPEIVITEPQDGTFTDSEEIKLNFQVLNMANPDKISITFNGRTITSLEPNNENEYEIFFVPPNWQTENRLRVIVSRGRTQISKTITIFRTFQF